MGADLTQLVQACAFRGEVRRDGRGDEVARCRLLEEMTGLNGSPLCDVTYSDCLSCCRETEPSATRINSAIALLLRELLDIVVLRGGVAQCSVEAALRLRSWARSQLRGSHEDPSWDEYLSQLRRVGVADECAYFTGEEVDQPSGGAVLYGCAHSAHASTTLDQCKTCRDWRDRRGDASELALEELVPPRKRRQGSKVKQWAVGVTTAPRRQDTLDECLDSIRRAGWDRPHLFMDTAVPLAQRHADLPVSLRPERLGAWPNYYLSLVELLMMHPKADAFMLIQDDVIFYGGDDLPKYLSKVLWPSTSIGAVSLYCSEAYTKNKTGWFKFKGDWRWGALAFVFSRESAKQFVADGQVLGHRWNQQLGGRAGIDVVIGRWAKSRQRDIFYSSPSLVQHIGRVSTLWPGADARGVRGASHFVGDLVAESRFEPKTIEGAKKPRSRREPPPDSISKPQTAAPKHHHRATHQDGSQLSASELADCGAVKEAAFVSDISTFASPIKRLSEFRDSRPIRITPSHRRLKVGFVSLWFERGQAYVTRMLRAAISSQHETFVLARASGNQGPVLLRTSGEWDVPNLTTHDQYSIPPDRFREWIRSNGLDVVFFNEEYDFGLVQVARDCGAQAIGYYVWELFNPAWYQIVRSLYTAVICPTESSYQRFRQLGIDNAVHIPWGIEPAFTPGPELRAKGRVRFFHPAGWGGMHARRGTEFVRQAFETADIANSELLIHMQIGRGVERHGKVVVQKGTVPRYKLLEMYRNSDVAVLPSKWEGLGLTFLESMGCGLPIITLNAPPMNEFVRDHETGLLCDVSETVKYDGIFVPGVHAEIDDLARNMQRCSDPEFLQTLKSNTKYQRSRFSCKYLTAAVLNLVNDLAHRASSGTWLITGSNDSRFDYITLDRTALQPSERLKNGDGAYENQTVTEILAYDILDHCNVDHRNVDHCNVDHRPEHELENVLSKFVRWLAPGGLLKLQTSGGRESAVDEIPDEVDGSRKHDAGTNGHRLRLPEIKRRIRDHGLSPTEVRVCHGHVDIRARKEVHGTYDPLRITLVSSRWTNHPWGTGNFIHRALKEMGHEVLDVDFRRDRKDLLELLQEPVDLLIVYKGSGIPPRAIETLPWPTALWYPDDVMATSHAQSDLQTFGAAYDHVFYFDAAGIQRLRQMGITSTSYLPLATDPKVYHWIPDAQKRHDITFVGSIYPNRRSLLDRIKRRFDVTESRAHMQDMVRLINESRIVLNLGIGSTGYPLRVFETLGCGAFLLTNQIVDGQLFADERHLVYFDSSNIEQRIEYYLSHADERERIARTGRSEILAKHTFTHRIETILDHFKLRREPSGPSTDHGSTARGSLR